MVLPALVYAEERVEAEEEPADESAGVVAAIAWWYAMLIPWGYGSGKFDGSTLGANGGEVEPASKAAGSTASEPGRVAEGEGAFACCENAAGSVWIG